MLFKYLSPGGARKALAQKNEVSLRFGLPKTYNDPYELFLQTDRSLESEDHLAFYEYFLGEIPQLPVTCFSKHPNSVVMWAHYCREMAGVCLGFDEEALTNLFPIAYIDDVSYSDRPAQIKSSIVDHALTTGKRRHTLRLLEIAHRAAYFMKRTDWSYESERRLVVSLDDVEPKREGLIARIDPKSLRYIIVGGNAERRFRQVCQARATQLGVPLLQFRVGKRTYEPYFVGADGSAVKWSGVEFDECSSVCADCGEPTPVLESGR